MRFTDKVVVITGGNSGIGLEAARAFSAEGAKVAIFGRSQSTLDQAAKEMNCLAVQGDVSNRADLKKLFDQVSAQYGKVDVVFANAGVAEFMPFEMVDDGHYDRSFDINVKGVILTVQAALPVVNSQASIILTTSVVTEMGEPNTVVYAATKSAVRSMARTLSSELLPRGVRVNVVSPGPIDTPIFDRLGMDAEGVEGIKSYMASRIPAGRMGQTNDIAQAVLFLGSSDSAFMAGSEVTVDGGFVNSEVLPKG